MNRVTLALVAALMLGSGIAGYLIGRPTDTAHSPPAPPAVAAPAAPVTPPASSPAPTPTVQPTGQRPPFGYQRLSIDSTRSEAEACLAFSRPLVGQGAVKYEDYLSVAPAVRVAVHVAEERLCLAGLAWGTDYRVELRTGFPAADGAKLEEPVSVEVALAARPAALSLPGRGFILPRGAAAGVPVTTVNLSHVRVAVFRVGERALQNFAVSR